MIKLQVGCINFAIFCQPLPRSGHHQGWYQCFFHRKKTPPPPKIYASGRRGRVATAVSAERTPTPVSHIFLPRDKLSPVLNLCLRQQQPPPVSNMFSPTVKKNLPLQNIPLFKLTVATLCALLTSDLSAIAKLLVYIVCWYSRAKSEGFIKFLPAGDFDCNSERLFQIWHCCSRNNSDQFLDTV